MQPPPPRLPNGLFPPEVVPRLPRHDGKPQDGRTYQWGDPGQAIGEVKSVASTFGDANPGSEDEDCTFIGTEGVAMTNRSFLRFVRFCDAPWLMVKPISIGVGKPRNNPSYWTWLDAQYRPLFQYRDYGLGTFFGLHAEFAHAQFALPQARESQARGGLRFWTGGPCYVHLHPDAVEVQQLGRRDVVPAADITVTMEDNFFELVLTAPQFYEARFLMGEVTNRTLLQLCLKRMGAKIG